MIRDFSDSAKTTLLNLIDEVNEEQWFDWTDAIGDFFCWGLNIEDYLNDLDSYHKKVLDKNNTTKEQIENIFNAVNLVDASYESIFKSCKQAIQEQINYIKGLSECIDPSLNNFNIDYMQQNMNQKLQSVKQTKINYYMEKLRNGEGNGDYDYEYLKEIMAMNPEDVSTEMYNALINVFNEMDTNQKEKFIENSYIVGDFYHNISNPSDWLSGKYEYSLSKVFQSMVEIDAQVLNRISNINDQAFFDEKVQKYVSDFNLLNTISNNCKIYVVGQQFASYSKINDIDITLTQYSNGNGHIEGDWNLQFNGSLSVYKTNAINADFVENASFDVYALRTDLDGILDENIVSVANSMKIDLNEKQMELCFDTASDLAMSFIPFDELGKAGENAFNIMILANDTVSTSLSNVNESVSTNNKLDLIVDCVKNGNYSRALYTGASISINNIDNSYLLNMITVDINQLSCKFDEYNEKTGNELYISDYINYVKGDVEGLPEDYSKKLDDYVTWATKQNGVVS